MTPGPTTLLSPTGPGPRPRVGVPDPARGTGDASASASASAAELVRAHLQRLAGELSARGGPEVPLAGKLLRPLVGLACVPPDDRAGLDDRFWLGLLAVQMVHEASLLHDDILDRAQERRGRPTVAARDGVAVALVRGDHLLTAAYGVAARTGSQPFLRLFVEAVERTVAGELRQARAAGRRLHPGEYEAIVRGKSGELFGCVTALHPMLAGADEEEIGAARERGLELGALYQRIDDLLDYFPAADTGKLPLRDHAQGKWTWVLDDLGGSPLERPALEVARSLVTDVDATARRCLETLREHHASLLEGHACAVPGDDLLPPLTRSWLQAAERGVEAQEAALGVRPDPAAQAVTPLLDAALVARGRALGGPEDWEAYFARHSRSFRFASRLFPEERLRAVTGVYAFCRFTDDLADETADLPPGLRRARLDRWLALAQRARDGSPSGVPLLDRVMGSMARADVSFRHVEGLVAGVASDVGRVRIGTDAELRRYTYRVASVVGEWITELFGVGDPAVLSRASALGHAMQLTNILRDVGEDWRMDRVYLPAERMRLHGVDESDIRAVAEGEAPSPRYRQLLEDLMAEADRHYDAAAEALPLLPAWFARPVAVAARVYQGIHDEIRRNGYDNVTRRGVTSLPRKLALGVRALVRLERARGARRATALAPFSSRFIHADG